ncbi:MAG: DUF3343 domain-containing protein [Faecousia sp.]
MTEYLATFHTHLAALKSHRALTSAGLTARMAPVPRKISSSCGTCVFYTAEDPKESLLDADTEAIYRLDAESAVKLKEFD